MEADPQDYTKNPYRCPLCPGGVDVNGNRRKQVAPCAVHADAFVPRPYGGWSAQTWEGRARMARARKAAGASLDELDREALRREMET